MRKVSIIPRGRALGVTLSTPESDRYGYDANYLRGRIIGALGGMAAEQEVFNVVTTGAESDLEMVTRIARSMVGRWGMSERIGTLSVLPAEGDPRMAGISDGLLDAVDEEVRRITDECYAEARRLLRENRDKLDAIVAQLLAHESLDEPEIYAAAGIAHPPASPSASPASDAGARRRIARSGLKRAGCQRASTCRIAGTCHGEDGVLHAFPGVGAEIPFQKKLVGLSHGTEHGLHYGNRFCRWQWPKRSDVMQVSRIQLCAILALAIAAAPLRGQGQPPLPERLDSYIKSYVKLTPEEQKQLLAGQPVTRLLDTDPAKEVAIFGAVWVNAPVARYVAAVKDIEDVREGRQFPGHQAHQQPASTRRLRQAHASAGRHLGPEDVQGR